LPYTGFDGFDCSIALFKANSTNKELPCMLTGQILLQLIVILLVVQIFGFLCKYIGQPVVIGEILGGLALGPTLLGAISPQVEKALFPASALPTLQTLGDIGLVLYMFSLGTHIDTSSLQRQGRKTSVVSLGSVLLPLLLGGGLAFFFYPQFGGAKANLISFTLMLGTAMAITAFPVLARILEERRMLLTDIGALAMLCAAINDIAGWCLLAVVVAIIHATGPVSVVSILAFLAIFVGVMFGVVRPLLLFADRHLQSKTTLLVLIIILLLIAAYATNAVGIHPVFGAFMMGLILPRRMASFEQIHGIDRINNLLFLPLYFVYNGLRTQIGLINSPTLWLFCGLVLLIACAGKIAGGTLSLKLFGTAWKESLTLGVLMNTRGLVELILLNIALDLKVISPTFFAMLVLMAVITTMLTPPLLRLLGYGQNTPRDREKSEVSGPAGNTIVQENIT
jgi:Kef-type K+ transport system membrane component KefB